MFKPEEVGQLVEAYIKMVSAYLQAEQIKALQEAGKRPVQQDGDACKLMTEEECNSLLRGQGEFLYLDTKIAVKPIY